MRNLPIIELQSHGGNKEEEQFSDGKDSPAVTGFSANSIADPNYDPLEDEDQIDPGFTGMEIHVSLSSTERDNCRSHLAEFSHDDSVVNTDLTQRIDDFQTESVTEEPGDQDNLTDASITNINTDPTQDVDDVPTTTVQENDLLKTVQSYCPPKKRDSPIVTGFSANSIADPNYDPLEDEDQVDPEFTEMEIYVSPSSTERDNCRSHVAGFSHDDSVVNTDNTQRIDDFQTESVTEEPGDQDNLTDASIINMNTDPTQDVDDVPTTTVQENELLKTVQSYCPPKNSGNINIQAISDSKSKVKKYFCIYCKKLFSKLFLHLERVHSAEPDVKKFAMLPKGCEERRNIIEIIRKKGAFEYNTDEVLNTGDLIPCRRPMVNLKKNANDYKICPSCKGMYSKNSIRKHYPKCVPNWVKGDRFVTAPIEHTEQNLDYTAEQLQSTSDQSGHVSVEDMASLDSSHPIRDSWSKLDKFKTVYGKKRCVSPIGHVKRTSWSTPEKRTALHLFGSNIEAGEIPTLPECHWAIKSYEVLKNRSPAQLKAWVHNEMKRKSKKGNTTNKRVFWSSEEKVIMNREFKKYLDDGILPGLVKCADVRNEYPILQHRNAATIKAWINNTIRKKKRNICDS